MRTETTPEAVRPTELDRHTKSLARGIAILAAALALGPLAAASADAQCTGIESRATITVSKLGETLEAAGTAGYDISADCSQILGVNVIANLPNGERLVVMAVTSSLTITIGTITIFDTFGQMVTATQPQGLLSVNPFPLSNLKQIQIYRDPNPTGNKAKIIRPLPLQLVIEATF